MGYPHDEFLSHHIDGSPWDFLAMIDGAEYVLTDSFHATVFSIIFHKAFSTFERQYVHGHSQSTRITDLLDALKLDNHYNEMIFDDRNQSCVISDSYFEKVRKDFGEYINIALNSSNKL